MNVRQLRSDQLNGTPTFRVRSASRPSRPCADRRRFGGFGTWAFTAPLAAAVIAQGSFVATGQNKIVQHLEGGIIKEILVSEGDHVQLNQPLVLLDETAAQANERQLFLRQARLEAIVARLTAEAEGAETRSSIRGHTRRKVSTTRKSARSSPARSLNFQGSQQQARQRDRSAQPEHQALEFRADGYEQQLNADDRQQRAPSGGI